MIIKQLDIIGYGKWIDQTFDIHPKLHIFYGKNESGKSTLISFIHSILFGFPTRKQKMNRFEPMKTSKYGGRVHVSQSLLGNAVIERLDQTKVSGDVRVLTDNNDTLDDSMLSNMLYNVDSNLYRNIFSFDLSDLEKINQLKPAELEADFLNISVSGANEYLSYVKQLNDKADKIYKPGGRVLQLNKAIDQLKEQEHLLTVAESKNKLYLNQLDEYNQIDNKIKQKNKQIEDLKEQVNKLQFLLNNWSKFERYQYLNKELQRNDYFISQDDRLIFENLMTESQELSNKIDVLNNELKNLQTVNFSSKLMDEYLMNKLYYSEHFKRLPQLLELSNTFQQVELKLSEKTKHLQNLRYQLNLDQSKQIPKTITDEETTKLKQWQDSISETKESIRKSKEQLYKYSYQIEMLENQNHSQNENQSLIFLIVPVVLFLFISISSWLADFNFPLSILTGVVLSVVSYFVMKGLLPNKTISIDNKKSDIEELQTKKIKLEDKVNYLGNQLEEISLKFKEFLDEHHLTMSLTIEEVISKRQFYNELIHQTHDVKKLEYHRDGLYKQLMESTENLKQLSDLYPINYKPTDKIHNLNQMRDTVESELKQNEDSIQEINYLTKQLEEFNKNAEIVDTQLNRLMDKYQLDSIIKLNQLIKNSNRLDESREELHSLKSILSRYNELLDPKLDVKYESAEMKLKNYEDEIDQLNEQRDELFDKKSTLRLELSNLEEGKDYAFILQKYENQVSVVNDLTEEWLVNKLASDIVDLTIRQGIKEELPLIMDTATTFFNKLTLGNYQEIRLENNKITVVNTENEEFSVSDLSRGTAEPLYAALRLAVIQLKTDEVKLPILIDDSFVNVDSARREIIYDILEEISQDTQVIIFTFDDNVLTRFSNEHITKL